MGLPADAGLPGLSRLFDGEWVWQTFCARFGAPDQAPERIRLRHLHYQPGHRAVVGYVAERIWEHWLVEDEFAIELDADRPERIFRYPNDPYLPGLARAASATEAHRLITKHVGLHPHRLRVEAVRYRPTGRAVLRHVAEWRRGINKGASIFVRVVPPARVGRVLKAAELIQRSGFASPKVVGSWREGGVIWIAATPGRTLRTLIRDGGQPDPELILDGLAQMWAAPLPSDATSPLDLTGGFRWTERLLTQVLLEDEAREKLRRLVGALAPFVAEWRPTALSHNDFYDDQLLLTPSGRLTVVDFEEVGPGDPLLDVGNLLAHLRWMASFGTESETCAGYRGRFRQAAVARFRWDERELALREAFALFRLSSNPVRTPVGDWQHHVEQGLELALQVLEEAS